MYVGSNGQSTIEDFLTFVLGFKLLSESEQTASLYTLLQHAKPAQVKFLSAVLQQMSDGAPAVAAAGDTSPLIIY